MRLKAGSPPPPPPAAQSSQQRWDLIKQAVETPFTPPTAASSSSSYSPPTTLLDARDMDMYGATPLEPSEGQNIVRCKDCDKPIFESAVPLHAVHCQQVRERQQHKPYTGPGDPAAAQCKRRLSDASQDSASATTKKSKPSLVVTLGDSSKLGRGGDATNDGKAGKKKVKDPSGKAEKSAKTTGVPKASTRVRTQVDVDKHCGVINDKGFPCSRSLTCKTHSMGAKRSVPHRSQPYDMLLYEWHKKTKADFGNRKPVQPRVGPGSEAYGAAAEGRKRKKGDLSLSPGGTERRTGRDKGKAVLVVGEWEDSDEGDEGFVDSEEEVEAVLKGLKRVVKPKPLVMGGGGGAGFSATSMFVARNLKLGRLREVLGGVFGGPGVPVGGV